MKRIRSAFPRSFLGLLIPLICAPAAQADYRSTVPGDAPAGYWRLDEPLMTTVCTNYGSAGAALNANYNFGKFIPRPGAITGDADTSAGFDGVMSRVEVPFTPALNTTNAVSVEFRAMLNIARSAASTYYAPVWSPGNASTCDGYLFYVDPNNKWIFWMGATNASGNYWLHADSNNTDTQAQQTNPEQYYLLTTP